MLEEDGNLPVATPQKDLPRDDTLMMMQDSPSPFIREHSVFFNSEARRQAELFRRQKEGEERDSGVSEELFREALLQEEGNDIKQQSQPDPDAMIVSSPAMVASMGMLHGHRIPAEVSARTLEEQALRKQLWDANHMVIRLKHHIENLKIEMLQERAAADAKIRHLEESRRSFLEQRDVPVI